MPHPSTTADPADSSPPRRTHEALPAFLSGSVGMFLIAAVLTLVVVGLVAGMIMMLIWSVMPR